MDKPFISGFPSVGDGVWADIKPDGRNLRLLSRCEPTGWEAGVFDLDQTDWLVHEWADDEEDGMRRAEALARTMLNLTVLPPLGWKRNGQT